MYINYAAMNTTKITLDTTVWILAINLLDNSLKFNIQAFNIAR